MSRSWDKGSTAAWRVTRQFVIQRDAQLGYACRAHEDGWCAFVPRPHICTGRRGRRHAHHVHGRGKTGDDPRWIVSSCAACNLHIGSPEDYNPQPTPKTRW